ncbi:MAG TPA: mechanosensitive ion channel domain-containing protein [Polyangiaceae bacterium]|jgi:small-conductance mechanosensitive channel
MKRLSSIKRLGLLIVATLLTLARSAGAQTPAPAASATPAQVEAPVVVFNRTVAVLRGPLLGIAPAERVRHSEARLSELFARPGPIKISVMSMAGVNAILVNGTLGLALTPDDVDRLEGETFEHATQAAREALERVAAETREARDRERLGHALAASGIATLLLLLIFVVVLRARAWVVRHLTRLLEGSTHGLTAAGIQLLHPSRLFAASRLLVRLGAAFVLLLATYRWSSFVLNQFPYTRAWGEELDGYLIGLVLRIGGGALRALPDLLVALIIFLLARSVIAVARPVFDGIEKRSLGGGWLDADTAKPTRRIFAMAVWAFAAVMAYPYLPGASSEAFKGVSVLLGLMVTLGGSSLFGQVASGFILLYSRTLRIGEFIRVGEDEGTVVELGIFTTKISTGHGELLSLPNAFVLGTVTRNYSRPAHGHGFMLRTKVTIGYDAPWRQVQGLLISAARRTPGVAAEPPPQVFQTALSDFYIEYQLVCQASQAHAKTRAEAIATLNANVIDVFNEYGVQIMSPHYLADPSTAKVVPRSAWHAAPAPPPADDEPAPPG